MSEEAQVVSVKGMSAEQLARIEAQAIIRYRRMWTNNPRTGNLTLAIAALLMEICDIALPDTRVYIIAQEDMRSIITDYLRRHKLSSAFPYKNGQLLDYAGYADFTRVTACIG